MSAVEKAAELRRLADHYESIGEREVCAAEAKAAYRDGPSPETKAAHLEAKAALRAARQEARESGLLVADATPGSVMIAPQAVTGKGGVN